MADTGESSDDTEREFDDFEPCDEKELEILYWLEGQNIGDMVGLIHYVLEIRSMILYNVIEKPVRTSRTTLSTTLAEFVPVLSIEDHISSCSRDAST